MDLISDLDRMPRRDQGTRIRDLAMIGLAISKGGAAAVATAAPQAPVPAKEKEYVLTEAEKRGKANVARVKGGLMGGSGMA